MLNGGIFGHVKIRAKTNLLTEMGNIELLIESKLSPLQQDYAIALEKSVDGLIALINNTISFARADAGRIIIDECK